MFIFYITDILHPDGTAKYQDEVEYIKSLTAV
jgi:hypothetical protein